MNIDFKSFFTAWFFTSSIIQTCIMIGVGIPLIWFLSSILKRTLKGRVSDHVNVVINTFVFYGALILLAISALDQLGFELSAILGAAGIIGIAIGFAAQTSVSNIISGIFLLLERSFAIGDMVICDNIKGKVESIDLLAVKLRTFDNTLVRVPNEFFVKRVVKNISFYSTKRTDVKVSVTHDQDLKQLMPMLHDVASTNEYVLESPAYGILVQELTGAGFTVVVRVWSKQKNVPNVKRTLRDEIAQRADKAGMKVAIAYGS